MHPLLWNLPIHHMFASRLCFFSILWCSQIGDHSLENLVKFAHKPPSVKIKQFKNPIPFWLLVVDIWQFYLIYSKSSELKLFCFPQKSIVTRVFFFFFFQFVVSKDYQSEPKIRAASIGWNFKTLLWMNHKRPPGWHTWMKNWTDSQFSMNEQHPPAHPCFGWESKLTPIRDKSR